MSAPAKRETPRNLLAADDSGISRLNTVAACGYSPPANCREQPGSPIREKSDGKSRSAQLRVKLGAGNETTSWIFERRYSRGMEVASRRSCRRKDNEERQTES